MAAAFSIWLALVLSISRQATPAGEMGVCLDG